MSLGKSFVRDRGIHANMIEFLLSWVQAERAEYLLLVEKDQMFERGVCSAIFYMMPMPAHQEQ